MLPTCPNKFWRDTIRPWSVVVTHIPNFMSIYQRMTTMREKSLGNWVESLTDKMDEPIDRLNDRGNLQSSLSYTSTGPIGIGGNKNYLHTVSPCAEGRMIYVDTGDILGTAVSVPSEHWPALSSLHLQILPLFSCKYHLKFSYFVRYPTNVLTLSSKNCYQTNQQQKLIFRMKLYRSFILEHCTNYLGHRGIFYLSIEHVR